MLTDLIKEFLDVINDNDEYINLYIKSGIEQIDNINKLELGLFGNFKNYKKLF